MAPNVRTYSTPERLVTSPAIQTAKRAVVMISNRGFGGGSGAYLGNALVLTCDHLFPEQYQEKGINSRIVVSFIDGQASEAKILDRDKRWDLAILRLEHTPKNIAPIQLSRIIPRRGESVVSCGYGGRGTVRAVVGQVNGFAYDKHRSTETTDTMIVTGSVRSGDSGGPIINHRGHLCGVLWGSSNREIVGTQVGRCWSFGSKWLKTIQQSPTVNSPKKPAVQCNPLIKDDHSDWNLVRKELAQLRKQLLKIEQNEAKTGPRGPPGPSGEPGRDGKDAVTDIDRLADEVRKKIAGTLRIRVMPINNKR